MLTDNIEDMSRLLPYETILNAREGDPEALNAVSESSKSCKRFPDFLLYSSTPGHFPLPVVVVSEGGIFLHWRLAFLVFYPRWRAKELAKCFL